MTAKDIPKPLHRWRHVATPAMVALTATGAAMLLVGGPMGAMSLGGPPR